MPSGEGLLAGEGGGWRGCWRRRGGGGWEGELPRSRLPSCTSALYGTCARRACVGPKRAAPGAAPAGSLRPKGTNLLVLALKGVDAVEAQVEGPPRALHAPRPAPAHVIRLLLLLQQQQLLLRRRRMKAPSVK